MLEDQEIETRSFNQLWKDSWLEPQEHKALVDCIKVGFDPTIYDVALVNLMYAGLDGGTDYAGLCVGKRFISIDLKKPARDPGEGMFCVAVLTSPNSDKLGWALRDNSDTDVVVWYYQDTKRMALLDFRWLRRVLSLKLKEAYKLSEFPGKLHLIAYPGGRRSGGALMLSLENLQTLAAEIGDQPYVSFAQSVNKSDWLTIRRIGQEQI